MARLTLAVLISGRGSNLEAIAKAIDAGGLDAEIAVAVSDKKDAKGLDIALEHGIRAVWVGKEDRFENIHRIISSLSVDLVVLAGFMRIVPGWFVDLYYGRMINIHPSLLPSFPGLHAQRQALEHGVKVSGCTVHFVDHGCDTGPVIGQIPVTVMEDDDEDSLSARILAQEHRLLPEVVGLIGAGRVTLDGKKARVV